MLRMKQWFDNDFLDSNMDGVDQWDSLRTAGESKRSEFVYNIDDMKPEQCGHAAIRYVSGCLLVHNSEPFNLSLTNHFRLKVND